MTDKVDANSDAGPGPTPGLTGASPSPSDSQAAKSVLDAVDFELAQVSATQRSSGWTLWAVLAALATNLWLISDIVKQDPVWLPGVRFLFLLMSLGIETAILAAWGLGLESPLFPPRLEKRLIQGWPVSSVSPAEFILDSVKKGVLIWFVSIEPLPVWLKTATYVYLGVQLLVLPLLLLVTLVPFPIEARQTRRDVRKVRLIYVALTSLGIVIMTGYTLYLLRMPKALMVADYRLAGALVAFLVLLGLLVRFARRPPTLAPLLEVRRSLAFGYIGPDVARQRVERLVIGSRPADLVEEATERVKEIVRLIDTQHQRALAAADRLAARYQADGADGIVPNDEVERWWRRYVLRRALKQHKALICEMKLYKVRLFLLTAIGGPEATEAANQMAKHLVLDMAAATSKQILALMERSKTLRGKGAARTDPGA